MNKLYALHIYMQDKKFSEFCTFRREDLQTLIDSSPNPVELVESNEVHDIYRIDI